MTRTTSELTRAIRNGDRSAFAEFYRIHIEYVLDVARRVSRADENTCFDIVQEVFIRVIRNLPVLGTDGHVKRWFYCVVCSCIRDELRSRLRRDRREQAAAKGESAAVEITELGEQLDWLERELTSVPALERRLLSLRFEQGWTLRRIGESLGLNAGAVDGRIRRLLSRLRRRGEEAFKDDR